MNAIAVSVRLPILSNFFQNGVRFPKFSLHADGQKSRVDAQRGEMKASHNAAELQEQMKSQLEKSF
jgi:hypothetical protein